MRREVPIAITVVAGLIMLLDSFTKGSTAISTAAGELSKWVIIISAMLIGIACVNLIRIHGSAVARMRPNWIYSAALLATMAIYGVIGIMNRSYPDNAFWKYWYLHIFDNVQSPLGAAMFAIIAFYVASASYRAFRARSLEASVLLIAAVVIMLGKAPIGELLWSKFPSIANWMMKYPNVAGQRGIMIGASIGAFVTSMRVLIGLERGHLGGAD